MSTAKVFHTKQHARQELEKYYTPAWVTEALLRQFEHRQWEVMGRKMADNAWEPAAGNGEIVRVLQEHGWTVVASDISPDSAPHGEYKIAKMDFFLRHAGGPRNIITNPPFGQAGNLAFRFCWHALRLTQQSKGRVAMLLRDDFDSAGGRQQLFKFNPAWHKKVVLTERIRWTNLPQKEAGPSGNHAWFIWDWSREPGPATIAYEGMEP